MSKLLIILSSLLVSFIGLSVKAQVSRTPLAQVFSVSPVAIFLDQKTCWRYSGCFTARLNLECAALKQFAQLETTLQCGGNLEYYSRRKNKIVSLGMEVLRTTYLADGHFNLKFDGTVEALSIIGTVQQNQVIEFETVHFSETQYEKSLTNLETKHLVMKPFEKRFVLKVDMSSSPGSHSKIEAQRICHRNFYDHDVHDVDKFAIGGNTYIKWECWGEPAIYR